MSIIRKIFRLPETLASDPIDHPDLREMTARELADIPFPRIHPERQIANAAPEARGDRSTRVRPI